MVLVLQHQKDKTTLVEAEGALAETQVVMVETQAAMVEIPVVMVETLVEDGEDKVAKEVNREVCAEISKETEHVVLVTDADSNIKKKTADTQLALFEYINFCLLAETSVVRKDVSSSNGVLG